MTKGPVPHALVGEVFSEGLPRGRDNAYGHVSMEPTGSFEIRSHQTFKIVYTCGPYGLDDTGAIRICFRFTRDGGPLQTTDAKAQNYVTATTTGQAKLQLEYRAHGVHTRPRWQSLTIRVSGGYLAPGDTITVILGDTSGGGPGMLMQSFCESGVEFMVLADVIATGHYVPLPETPTIAIVPGKPERWKAVLPSLRRPGETFRFAIKAEDRWGNPSDQVEAKLRLEASLPVKGLPGEAKFERGARVLIFDDLSIEQEGVLRITVKDDAGRELAQSHPLVVRRGAYSGYWGDLHGQSGETVGINQAREYLEFARDLALLDVTSHQANDFQVNKAFWKHLNELTAEMNEDGRHIVFPGYEWSGNTAVGGDHNVFFRHEGREIHRSSHALLTDRSDIESDAPDLKALYAALKDEDCVLYAHVGGRYANIAYAHDPRLETSMEIHSDWGTFEWLLTDGFALGHRSGVVCNSDGHKGRPGASYPGTSEFGAYGGLTCFLASELTRDGIFDAMRRRHTYGTTGTRMHLDVRATLKSGAALYDKNPKAFQDARTSDVSEVMMGDIARVSDGEATLRLEVITQSPIDRVEVRNGKEVVTVLRGFAPFQCGDRIRVLWSGAEYRGRGRQTRWTGKVAFDAARISRLEKINAWNPDRKLEVVGGNVVDFEAITTGNFGGFDAWLDAGAQGSVAIDTNLGKLSVPLSDLDHEGKTMEAGGLERRIRVFRLPEKLSQREMSTEVTVPLKQVGDNPLWVCVTTEDGHQAWSSPIFLFNREA